MKGGKKKQATYVDGHHYRKTERQEKKRNKVERIFRLNIRFHFHASFQSIVDTFQRNSAIH